MFFLEQNEWPFMSTAYTFACIVVTMLCYVGYFKDYDLFFDTYLIFNRGEVSISEID